MINTKDIHKCLGNSGSFGYRGILPELPKLIFGNQNCYPNLGLGTSGLGNSGPGSGNSGTGNGMCKCYIA